MSVGFGHGAWLGFAPEVTFGTGVSPSQYLRILESNFGLEQRQLSKPSLGMVSKFAKVKSKKKVSGGFKGQFGFNGFETLLKHMCGASPTTSTPSAGVYQHIFGLGSSMLTGLTFHVNPDAANVGTAFQYEGCQIEKVTFKQSMEDFMEFSLEVQGEDEQEVAVATPSFPTFVGVDYAMNTVLTVGGSAVEADMAELTFENALAGDRGKLGSRLRKGIGRSGVRSITGKLEMEFDGVTHYDRFRSLEDVAIVITFVGAVISGGHSYTLTFSLPVCNLFGAKIDIKEAGPIRLPLEFEAFGTTAGNDEMTITLKNTTATVT
jgi:hypothetical protein